MASRRLFADGEWREAAVFERERLEPGDRFEGPAIVVEATGTTVVEPGWTARLTGRGELILEDEGVARSSADCRVVDQPDPVELELFNHRFAAIAEEMGAMLRRTALSVNVKERLDFSCAVFDGSGSLVANAPHMPVHLGAMSETVRCVLRDVPDLEPGDVVLTNDPFRGGSHLPDVTVVTPVFVRGPFDAALLRRQPGAPCRDRRHPARAACRPTPARWKRKAWCCGRGRWSRAATAPRRAARAAASPARYPSRAPDENLADVSAQIAANQLGVRRLLELEASAGREVTVAYMGFIQDAAQDKMRAALRRLGDGAYAFADRLDDGAPIAVRIEVRDGGGVLDFAGTAPPLPTNLNANRAIAKAAILYCFRCLIDEDIPLNEGVLAPLEVRIPRSVLDPPSNDDPALAPAVVGGNVETSQRVTDVILGALGLAAASQGTMNNLTFGDATFGYYETICGGAGAGPGFAGADAVHTHMTNTRLTDVEVLESRFPVRVVRFEIRRGSGGGGEWRGGDGCRRELEFLAPLQVRSSRSGAPRGRSVAPAARMAPRVGTRCIAQASAAVRARTSVAWRRSRSSRAIDLVIETPGGGGWGDPRPGTPSPPRGSARADRGAPSDRPSRS